MCELGFVTTCGGFTKAFLYERLFFECLLQSHLPSIDPFCPVKVFLTFFSNPRGESLSGIFYFSRLQKLTYC